MATERLAPDAILDQTGLTGSLTSIDEDPDSPDASWLTTSNNTSTVCHVSFPSPSGGLVNNQEFRVLVRKTNHSTNPTCEVQLYENGSLVSTVVASTTISSTTGTVLSGTWSPTGRTASQIECRVVGTPGGGSVGNRASVEVGAIEWNATLPDPVSGSGSGGYTLAGSATGGHPPANTGSAAGAYSFRAPGTSYAALVSAASPVAHWRFGEASGTTAVDQTGSHDGTYVGSPTLGAAGLLTDDADTSVDLPGSDSDYVSVAPGSFPTTALTIEAWIHADGLSGQYPRIVARDSTTAGQSFQLAVDNTAPATPRPFFRVKDSTDTTWYGGAFDTVLQTGVTYHIVATFDGSTLRCFVNGVQEATTYTFTGSVNNPTTSPLNIGRHANLTGFSWNGRIDEVAIYGSALTPGQVSTHYQAGLGAGFAEGAHPPLAPEGASTGAFDFAGVATGTSAPQGSSTGTYAFAGTATGEASPNIGAATGGFSLAGAAITGARGSSGACSGGFAFAGSAAGDTPPNEGGATGALDFAGSAVGEAPPNRGSVTGGYAFAGSAAGDGSDPNAGSAVGGYAFSGTASGERSSSGSASGSTDWAGSALGSADGGGAVIGGYSFAGSAAGEIAAEGSAQGSWGFAGSAAGETLPQGSASGGYDLTGTAGGDAVLASDWSDEATETTFSSDTTGTASGGYALFGFAHGQAPVFTDQPNRGSVVGAYRLTSAPVGGRESLGSVTGWFVYATIATGEGADPSYTFEPPSYRRMMQPPPLTRRKSIPVNETFSVVRINGALTQVKTPSHEQLVAAGTEGEDYFIGGHIYTVGPDVAQELQAAGYSVTEV